MNEVDSQEHSLKCHIILKHMNISDDIKYEHIFGTIAEQEAIVNVYIKVLDIREMLLNGEQPAHRGLSTGPTV